MEKKVYFQKPADGVIPAQAIAPPAPPPLFQPLSMPVLQTPSTIAPGSLGNPQPIISQLPDSPVRLQTPPAAAQAPVTQPPPAIPQKDLKTLLVPPKREDVFRFDSDAALEERIRREAAMTEGGKKQDVFFPPVSTPTLTPHTARSMPSMQVMIEPSYVCHRRLLFEEKNSERAGWDLGSAQPFISALHFYRDCLLLPHHLASNLLEPYDTSAGKCLPGCPTPLLWYPPEITLFGGTVGAAAVVGVAAILP